jgi:hypothetical protein
MKKIVLKVVKQCSATDGVQPQYVKVEILPQFFANFWVRRSQCPSFIFEQENSLPILTSEKNLDN